MAKNLRFVALLTAALLMPVASANAQHGHGGGHGGHSGGHGGHSGGHSSHSGGHSSHSGGHSGYSGGHSGYSGHSGHSGYSGHSGHSLGHSLGHGLSHGHHSDWHFVVPHHDRHYHGTYYLDGGTNYYVPQTYVADSGSYVAAKPAPVEFGGYAHVDDLAGRLERLANDLCLDLHHNYRHNPGFAETYREAYQILETAKYIHAKEHQADRSEVARRVDGLDGLFHHIQDDIKGWSRRHYRQIGELGAQTKLEMVEATLHHLMNDVGVKGSHGAPEAAAPAIETAPAPDPASSAPVPRPAN